MKDLTLPDEWQIRVDLAASLRITARLNMHEAVANHFSAAVSEDGSKFLINPKWKHFSTVKASDLILLDANDPDSASHPKVDKTAWAIHGQIHKTVPSARVVMHLHPIHATAIACLKTPVIPPIDQNSARYFNRVAIDSHYGGMADSAEEGARLAALLGNHSRLMMGNHGVLVISDDIGVAFDDMYTMERACEIVTTAYATGQELNVLADDVAEATALDWEGIRDFSREHFEQMKLILDAEDPSYAE